jgi:nicotinamidase-related amidase
MGARRAMTWIVFVSILMTIVSVNALAQTPRAEKRMKPALLVIDIQNKFLDMMSKEDKDIRMYILSATVELFREKGFPIIRVYHSSPEEGPKPGTEAFEFPPSVPVKPDDPMIIKTFPNAFKKTGLDQLLRDRGCNTVFCCGLSAVGCVLATHFGADELDYDTFMIKDAVLSHNAEYTRSIETIMDAVGYQAVKAMLENAVPENAWK